MKIGVSSWSMNQEFIKGMTMVDFVRVVKEEFGADAVEMVHWMVGNVSSEGAEKMSFAFEQFSNPDKDPEKIQKAIGGFMEVMDEMSLNKPENLEDVKMALEKYGVKVLNMPIDYGNISGLDEEKRKSDLAVIKSWIDIAAYLGSTGARVNTGQQPEGVFDLSITADSYRELAEYAETKGVALVLENHGGMSADPKNILKLFEMVNHPNFRVCPDFGNFDPEIRYEAIDMIFNNPILVHAKTYEFNEDGSHVQFDFGKCMEIAKKHNYDGYYSVEFEGPGDQREGIQKTIDLLKKCVSPIKQ
ncbi:sugar phosphate isomerase/epimerase family protein [Lederbergia citrea]|uniref:sugar phosphate isomerase/epimerase family protein n=1 Tax=Lederbergia citrea TaxID=2833581 RepID=UPI001BC94E8C|nr:sugar phosphate isomerase/epimerase family protein [Lederbergia citrea]MBS4204413.1 sugar phosphate isomerase/epimerase [Lederbergia citrea]